MDASLNSEPSGGNWAAVSAFVLSGGYAKSLLPLRRRGAGVVERGGLENRCTLAGTEGSNPSPSAKFQ